MDQPLTEPELPIVDDHVIELTKIEKQAQEYLDGWKRAKADYLNLKKQNEKEKQDLVQFSQATAILQFLPIYTNMQLALKHVPAEQQDVDWIKGLAHIQKQFADVLKTMGLEPIKTIGEKFDPNLHHAVSKIKSDSAADTVIAELKPGWKFADRVLEPAQVTVAE